MIWGDWKDVGDIAEYKENLKKSHVQSGTRDLKRKYTK